MDEYQDLDSMDEPSPEESAVMKELRTQLRAAQAQNEKLKEIQAEVELAAQTQRGEAAKEIVNTLGLPGLEEDVLTWVTGEVTQTKVIEALEARSIPLPEGTAQPNVQGDQVQSASSVGQQVADAAAGGDGRTLDERINAAESQEELNALMQEADLTRSHF